MREMKRFMVEKSTGDLGEVTKSTVSGITVLRLTHTYSYSRQAPRISSGEDLLPDTEPPEAGHPPSRDTPDDDWMPF